MWFEERENDQTIIVYHVQKGVVYGGTHHEKSIKKEMARDGDFYIGDDFKMELDMMSKVLTMQVDGEKFVLDENLGDFEFSPIVTIMQSGETPLVEVTLL